LFPFARSWLAEAEPAASKTKALPTFRVWQCKQYFEQLDFSFATKYL
jgi:hypothetical protein